MPGYVRKQFRNQYRWEADAKVTQLQKALILILILIIQPEHGNASRQNFNQLPKLF
jgi:hypothetical protein